MNKSCTECKQNVNKWDRLRIKYILTLVHVYEKGLNTKISSAARWLLGNEGEIRRSLLIKLINIRINDMNIINAEW